MATAWYYQKDGVTHGPVSSHTIREMAIKGTLAPTDLLRKEGTDTWLPAGHSEKLFPGRKADVRHTSHTQTEDRDAIETKAVTSASADLHDSYHEKDSRVMDAWYYEKQGQRHGPIDTDELKAMARSGDLSPNDLVWKQGMDGWTKASQIKGLLPTAPAAGIAPPPLPDGSGSARLQVTLPDGNDYLPNKGLNPIAAAVASWLCAPLGYLLVGQTNKGVYVFMATLIGFCLCLLPGVVIAILGIVDTYSVAKAVSEGQHVGKNEYRMELLYKIVRTLDNTATYRP